MRKSTVIRFLIVIALAAALPASVHAQDMDWGDAPDPTYPTLLVNNGASHSIVPGMFLGATVDSEFDGQPNATATGDDIDGNDDDDGVTFTSPIMPGTTTNVTVISSLPGVLDAWLDFDGNGSWAHPGEQIFVSFPLNPGANALTFPVPPSALIGTSFARFRLSLSGGLTPAGFSPEGEVEDYEVFIGEEQFIDWGDAPDPTYPTLAASSGANHLIGSGIFLGASVDWETDGQPDATATGDDNAGTDDEDGITFTSPLIPGTNANVTVVASAPGLLDAWVDFDSNGTWAHPSELIFASLPLISGVNYLMFAVPANATLGRSFARFRISSPGSLLPTGSAPDGEVEDEQVFIGEEQVLDWGDAPDPTYPTLAASGGASHVISGPLFMGASIDAESDGQPDATATGDDNDGNDDDDGVSFISALLPGTNASVTVIASGSGLLDAWVDFDLNGTWAHPGEQIFASTTLAPGPNTLNFAVPGNAASGSTFARFRVSTPGGLQPTGASVDGEVEDHEVLIEELLLDFGDAPDAIGTPGFPTLLANNGARHIPDGVTYLGNVAPDTEPDGLPNGTATGDDLSNSDDEEGVLFNAPLIPGFTSPIDVFAGPTTSAGLLDAWIDFNGNGSWMDPGEQIAVSLPLVPGPNPVLATVPSTVSAGGVMSRFRISTAGGLAASGLALDGEVEDYEVTIEDPIYDWGDAPDPHYPTLAANSGAVHQLVENMFLGSLADAETDGQPDASATGDDLDGSNDDDGVHHFPSGLPTGGTMYLTVTASASGNFNAFVDFNGDGDWTDTGEHIIVDQSLTAGVNSLSFAVPADAVGPTFARYRFSTATGLSDIGAAFDGEVEDYQIYSAVLFCDDFETGDLTRWSSSTP